MDDNRSFGRWLQRRRRALDLTQTALARRVGCTSEHLRNIEAGRRRPSRDVAARLATCLAIEEADHAAFVAFARGQAVTVRPVQFDLAKHPAAPLANGLSLPPTPLLGREHEVAAVCALLRQPAPRLVTLTGTGGTGKTRVALEVARVAASAFRDGVTFVALAAITDPALLASAIAQALGLSGQGDRPIEAVLRSYLADKQHLLILDNFEQLVDAALLVADVMTAAPQLTVLVTSRVPLRLAGEQHYPILPLALPDLEQVSDPAALASYAAIALFEQRVQAVQPAFRVAADNARLVAAICVHLDGLPLAIELVATRTQVLGLETLLARLHQRLALLTDGARDLPARQQTMRATLDWSFALLKRSEQVLFRRLGVFANGCSLEAIEAVCSRDGDLHGRMLDTLQALIASSLVQPAPGVAGAPRFGMLELIREYALERLVDSGEAEPLRQQHATYFLTLAEAAEGDLGGGARQAGWLAQLEEEHANLRAALTWTVSRGGDMAARLSGALWLFWNLREYLSEGRRWLEATLAADTAMPATVRAKALHGAAELASAQGEHAVARVQYEESLELYRALGDQQRIATVLHNLALVAHAQGEQKTARTLVEESLARFRALGNTRGIASAVNDVGNVAYDQGDYATARARLEESLALFRALDSKRGIAWSLRGLGLVAHAQGEHATAQRLLEESLALFRTLDSKRGIAWALRDRGLLAYGQGEHATARARLEESLALFRALDSKRGIAWALRDLGLVAHAQGEHATAQRLLEESLALFRTLDSKRGIAYTVNDLGNLAYDHGNHATAQERLDESLRMFRAMDDRWGISRALDGLAATASARAEAERALRLAGAATRLREELGAASEAAARVRLAGAVERSRRAVGAAAAETAWRAGREVSLEQAVQEALAGTKPGPDVC